MAGATNEPPGGSESGRRRATVLKVKLPCATLDDVRARHPELRELRFRFRTRERLAVGTRVRLETTLSDGTPCFGASAFIERVAEATDTSPGSWTLRIATLDERGQELVAWMGGLPPVALDPGAEPALTPAPLAGSLRPVGPARAAPPPPAAVREEAASPPPVERPRQVPPPLPRTVPGPDAATPPAIPLRSPPGAEARPPAPAPPADRTPEPSPLAGPSPARPAAGRRPEPPRGPPPSLAPAVPTSPEPVFEEDVAPALRPTRGRIIGIDLGTSNSAAAAVKSGKPFIIPSREGYSTIPSVVALSERGSLVVGHVARDRLLVNPRGTVHGAKRLIGRQFQSPVVRDLVGRFSYEIVAGPRGEAAVRLGERVYSLQKISSMVLAQVKQLAEQWLGEEVSRAVITVPAYYNDNQRQAVRAAGALAGLHVERIVNEPTAAAIAFAQGRAIEKRVMVYDLGGGTFDTSVLELQGNVYEVVATGGDTFLGGVDFDKALVDDLLARFRAEHGVDFSGDRVAYQRITDAAERTKVALSERLTAQVDLPFVTAVGSQAYALKATVTRAELEGRVRGLVERTLRVCDDVLTNAGLSPSDIGEVLLVGGQSRMPLVRSMIKEFFGKEPSRSVHPDEAVALGAAILADSLQNSAIDAPVLLDVLPMSIGIGQPGGRFKRIIDRNTRLPCRRTHSIWTSARQGTTLSIPVFQGESEHAQENEYLGTLLVADLPPGDGGDTVFDVTFTLSSESILTVTAEERGTARSVTATFNTQDSPEAVRRALSGEAEPAAPRPPEEETGVLVEPGAGDRSASPDPEPGRWGHLVRWVRSKVGGPEAR